MELHLGGHIGYYGPERGSRVHVRLERRTPLVDVLQRLGIPEAEVAIAAVNREIVQLDHAEVVDADIVHLYPPVSGGVRPADCGA
jgi:sulfur carrier protein ThiS